MTNGWFLRALREVTHAYPHWNRTQGRDHLFVFAGARGAKIFADWRKHVRKSVFLTPEGDRSPGRALPLAPAARHRYLLPRTPNLSQASTLTAPLSPRSPRPASAAYLRR